MQFVIDSNAIPVLIHDETELKAQRALMTRFPVKRLGIEASSQSGWKNKQTTTMWANFRTILTPLPLLDHTHPVNQHDGRGCPPPTSTLT